MNRELFLAHWRPGLLVALLATVCVLLLAMARSPQFTGAVDALVFPRRVDSPGDGPFARQPVAPAELLAQFEAFAGGDGLRQFLSKQDSLDLGGGAFAQGLAEEFRKRISLTPTGEGLIRVRVEDTWPRRAALLAENLVLAYQQHLEARERERRRAGLEAWKEKTAAAERKLNIVRQAILSFRRLYLEAVEKYGGEKREDWRQALLLEQISARIGSLEERLEVLSGLKPEQFLQAANRWKLIDQGLNTLATQYLDHGSTLRALDASGLARNHVEVVASRKRFEESQTRLEAGINGLLERMGEEVEQEKNRRAALLTEREETWALLAEIGKRLEETKSVYEAESDALAKVQAALYAAQLEASLPLRVLEYDAARGARLELAGPSFLTDLALAPLMGVLCGLLTIQVRAWQTERKRARQVPEHISRIPRAAHRGTRCAAAG